MRVLATCIIGAGLSSAQAYLPEHVDIPNVSATDAEARSTLQQAEEKIRASFSNLTFSDFEPSPVPGFFQVTSGGRLIYYSPDPELLIFGQVFNNKGEDLTARELAERQRESLVLLGAVIIDGSVGHKTPFALARSSRAAPSPMPVSPIWDMPRGSGAFAPSIEPPTAPCEKPHGSTSAPHPSAGTSSETSSEMSPASATQCYAWPINLQCTNCLRI